MRMLYEQVQWRALESKIAIQILSEIIPQAYTVSRALSLLL